MARVRTLHVLVAALVIMALATSAAPGFGADTTVTVGPGSTYEPRATSVQPGDEVTWVFVHPTDPHTVSDASGLSLYESGIRKAGSPPLAYTFTAAGTYRYYCQFFAPDMVGTVNVGMRSVDRGSNTHMLHWASRLARPGFVYDVIRKAPGETRFTRWQWGTEERKALYTPKRRGTYKFRARIRRVRDGETPGWSPPLLVTR